MVTSLSNAWEMKKPARDKYAAIEGEGFPVCVNGVFSIPKKGGEKEWYLTKPTSENRLGTGREDQQ